MKKREFEITVAIKTAHKYEAENKIKELFKSDEIVSIKCLEKRRTTQQNKALHLYFTLLATELNDSGYDMKKTISKEMDINWNSYNIKEYLWRPLQKSLIGHKRTSQLKTNQIDEVYEVLNRVIAERTGVHVPFPSVDGLMFGE